ncbi:MAG: shikimate dehydrogenase [Halieaceae bacterium]|mgnify:FL=1|nr:shikimate dehydrogenase [Halieaceae bacterium]MDG1492597.1 shikimate dehydrogenase [Luminiphilus sp.]MDG1829199.1 shikimate dehydrogenase [Luminiphilus sp.]
MITPQANYAVFGNPIKQSKSPVIHQAFAQQLEESLSYRAVRVEHEQFEEKVRGFFQHGGMGLNITVPFKERAFALADSASAAAQRAGASNCLVPQREGGLHAANTDGVGMVRDMVANLGWQLQGRRTLIIGAGGAVRGIVHPLLSERLGSLTIVNRTADRAAELAERFSSTELTVAAGGLEAAAGGVFDLVINATSASLGNEMPDLADIQLAPRCCCYDLVYAAEPTAFMRWSAAQAAWAIADGLGMLVEQAAESYYLWRGQRPGTEEVISGLRHGLMAG